MVSEERKQQMINYSNANRDKVYKAVKAYLKRRLENPLYKEELRIRNIIRAARRNGGYKENSSLNRIVGCSWSDYMKHIESTWEDWMNWGNYGRAKGCWCIDHILPPSQADSIEGVRERFHYSNTRALCSAANTKKGNKEK
jgi:hypothetical protein